MRSLPPPTWAGNDAPRIGSFGACGTMIHAATSRLAAKWSAVFLVLVGTLLSGPAFCQAPDVVVPRPPLAAAITLAQPDSQGMTTVTGAAGAAHPDAVVFVTGINYGSRAVEEVAADGSFTAQIWAPEGTWVQVKHIFNPNTIEDLRAAWLTVNGTAEVIDMNASTGTMLRVPVTHAGPAGSVPFAFGGAVKVEVGDAKWTMVGNMGPDTDPGPATTLPITATLEIRSSGLIGIGLDGIDVGARFRLMRLFDSNGRQQAPTGVFATTFMTPTGLPISREVKQNAIEVSVQIGGWVRTGDDTIEAPVNTTLVIPADIGAGVYRPAVVLMFGEQVPAGGPPGAMRAGPFLTPVEGLLPILTLGDPTPPRLTWTLLTDHAFAGSLGGQAREDSGSFGLMPLTVFQSERVILPRIDAATGEEIRYRLEPHMPMVSMADRGVPSPPRIPFQLPSGELTVIVEKPYGNAVTLGPGALQQSTSRSAAYSWGKLQHNDGGSIHDVYSVTTLDETFDYVFDQYGDHVVTLSGTLEDVWGNAYQGQATFDVTVARRLNLVHSMLPTTPFEVGDAFAPGFQVYPPVPADVDIRVRHLVRSDPAQEQLRVFSGSANRFGAYHPGAGSTPLIFADAGEVRVDVEARYLAADGTLWVGSTTWGTVVASPGGPLVARGRRGTDVPGGGGTAWFDHSSLGTLINVHTFYPYFGGDVFWGGNKIPFPDRASDSIIPAVTFQDTVGTITQLVRDRWDTYAHSGIFPWETLDERIILQEIPLVSTTSGGEDALWSPQTIDQFGYAYRGSQRPGARVHETVSEDQLGIAYWRYDANYGAQVGVEGDLPNDLKWEFGGLVYRHLPQDIAEYAIYGSLWVLIPDDDTRGPRVMPPLGTAAGGPDGGPIFNLKGEDIHLLFLPRSAFPGQILEVGDTLSLAGHVGPPLEASLVNARVTSPSGTEYVISGRASSVGYFYQPGHDLVVDEAGEWTVVLEVVHDGRTSAGQVAAPFPTGGVPGADAHRYSIYVVDSEQDALRLIAPQPGYLPIAGSPIDPIDIEGRLPPGTSGGTVAYTITMPGFVLEQGTVTPVAGGFGISYDPQSLSDDFPNLDTTAFDEQRPGLADEVQISFLYTDDQGRSWPLALSLRGEELLPVALSSFIFADGFESPDLPALSMGQGRQPLTGAGQ